VLRTAGRAAVLAAVVMTAATGVASSQTVALAPPLTGISFLVGAWAAGTGTVADTGERSRGSSTFEAAAGGGALLRRDHTELMHADGTPAGAFDQIMLIYPEGGTLHADYTDGTHIIHYASAQIVPGRSVAFITNQGGTAPAYRLTYTLTDPATLGVAFEIEPPGQTTFHPIATGTLHRSP
jgi:hypothetical protein